MADKKITIRLSIAEADSAAVIAALEGIGIKGEEALRRFTSFDTSRAVKAFETLEKSVDPIAKATAEYAKAQDVCNNFMQKQADGADRAAATLAKVKANLDSVIEAQAKMSAGAVVNRQFEQMEMALNPLARATADYNKQQELGKKWLAENANGQERYNELMLLAKNHYDQVTGASKKMGDETRLNAWQMTQLSYQLQDMFVETVGGISPFVIISQQVPQAAMAVGGFTRLLQLALSPIALTSYAVLGLAGFFALLSYRSITLDSQVRSLAVSLQAFGNASQSISGLMAGGKAVYAAGGSKDDASAMEAELVKSKLVTDKLGTELMLLANNMSAGNGVSTPDNFRKLIEIVTQGLPAIERMDEDIIHLSVSQMEAVRTAYAHGESANGLKIVLDNLHGTFDGLREKSMSPLEIEMRKLGNAWDTLINHLAQSGAGTGVLGFLSGTLTGIDQLAKLFGSFGEGVKPPRTQESIEDQAIASAKDRLADFEGQYSRLAESRDKLNNPSVIKLMNDELDRLNEKIKAQKILLEGLIEVEQKDAQAKKDAQEKAAADEQFRINAKIVQESVIQYNNLTNAMKGTSDQRQIEIAGLNALKEAANRKMDGDQRAEFIALAKATAELQLMAAMTDQSRVTEVTIAGQLRIAQAWSVSDSAVRKATIAQQADIEMARSSLRSRQEVIDQLTRQAEAQLKVAAAEKETQEEERLLFAKMEFAGVSKTQGPLQELMAEIDKKIAEAKSTAIIIGKDVHENPVITAQIRAADALQKAGVDLSAAAERLGAASGAGGKGGVGGLSLNGDWVDQFVNKLITSESSGNWSSKTNTGKGYSVYGAYQMDPTEIKKYYGGSPDSFLGDVEGQKEAFTKYLTDMMAYAASHYQQYLGRDIGGGKTLDAAGLVAMMHLGGNGSPLNYFEKGRDPADVLGTHVSDYARKFSGVIPGDPGAAGGLNPTTYSGGMNVSPEELEKWNKVKEIIQNIYDIQGKINRGELTQEEGLTEIHSLEETIKAVSENEYTNTKKMVVQEQELNRLKREQADISRGEQLNRQYLDAGQAAEDYAKLLQDLIRLTDEHRISAQTADRAIIDGQIKVLESTNDLYSGMRAGYLKLVQEESNYSKMGEQIFTDTVNQMADVWDKFCQTGKLDFTQMVSSIVSEINKMAFKAMAKEIFGSLGLGGGGGEGGGGIGGIFGGLFSKGGGGVGGPNGDQYNMDGSKYVGPDAQGGFGDVFKGLMDNFKDMFKWIGDALMNLMKSIGSLFSGGGGGLGGLFGGLFGGGGDVGQGLDAGGWGGLYHSGGVVGATAVSSRNLSPWVWANAPRLHSGAYLQADEVPAILQRGERVIPAGGSSGSGTQIVMNVYSNDADSFRRTKNQIVSGLCTSLDAARKYN